MSLFRMRGVPAYIADVVEDVGSANWAGVKPTAKVVGIIKRNWREYCGCVRVPDALLPALESYLAELESLKSKQAQGEEG